MTDSAETESAARQRLLALRDATESRLAALDGNFAEVVAASESTNADDEHDPEGTTIGFERAQVVALTESARHTLAEIDAALERLDRGTYGVCENCGNPIEPGRLEARPTATLCMTCARAASR